MKITKKGIRNLPKLLALAGLVTASCGAFAQADDSAPVDSPAIDSPAVEPAAGGGDTAAPQNTGPIRLARIDYVSGNVSWRPDDSVDWSSASINIPLRQGAQIWLQNGAKAEVQFDDGSVMRLGEGAVATLQTLYSDQDGEFTEIKLNEGIGAMHLKTTHSIYQIDTPYDSVKSTGPSRFRVAVTDNVTVGVRTGSATLSTQQGDTKLRSGDFVDLEGSSSAVNVVDLPNPDSFDQFDDQRDLALNVTGDSKAYLPSNIAIVSGNLDSYGSWRDDPTYGHVWCPRVDGGWRPYYAGHWVYCDPFGWTWCGDEDWGWAPYHYGSWNHFSYGWGWCPGPVHQYWSPAVVNFSYYGGRCNWVPLCPSEVRYPAALSIGFASGNWALSFSIGACGIYSPVSGGYCVGRPFAYNSFYNRQPYRTFVSNHTTINNYYGNVNRTNINFVPRNARFGSVGAPADSFGRGGRFTVNNGNATRSWQQGQQTLGRSGNSFVSGPAQARPTVQSFSTSKTFSSSERPQALSRPLYRAPVTKSVAATGGSFGRTVNTQSIANTGSMTRNARIPGHQAPAAAPNPGAISPNRVSPSQGRVSSQGVPNRTNTPRNTGGVPDSVARARQSLGQDGGSRNNNNGNNPGNANRNSNPTRDSNSTRNTQDRNTTPATTRTNRGQGDASPRNDRSTPPARNDRTTAPARNDRTTAPATTRTQQSNPSSTRSQGTYHYRGNSDSGRSTQSRGGSSSPDRSSGGGSHGGGGGNSGGSGGGSRGGGGGGGGGDHGGGGGGRGH